MDTLTDQRSGDPAHPLELALRLGQPSGAQIQLNQTAVCDHELRVEHQRALQVVFGRHALTGLSDDL